MKACRFALWCSVLFLFFGGQALATAKRTPFQISVEGGFRPAENTRAFEVLLHLRIHEFGVLGRLRTADGRWKMVAHEALPGGQVAPGEHFRLPLRFVAAAGAEAPLTLIIPFDGKTYRVAFDLSPAGLAARRGSGLLRALRADEAKPEPGPARRRAGLAPSDDSLETALAPGEPIFDPEPEPPHYHRITGRVVYGLSNGQILGADSPTVRVYDYDSDGGHDYLGQTSADADGYFDITVEGSASGELSPDFFVRVLASNSRTEVRYFYDAGVYDLDSPVYWNRLGNVAMGSVRAETSAGDQVLHVLTTLTRAWRWVDEDFNHDVRKVKARLLMPDSFYVVDDEEIHLTQAEGWNTSIIAHEWGHHLLYGLFYVSQDYCDPAGHCDLEDNQANPDRCSHCVWCEEDASIAYHEGFSNWLADAFGRMLPGEYGVSPFGPYFDFETIDTCYKDGAIHNPHETEGHFGAFLRDIEDSANDNDPAYPAYGDKTNLTEADIMAIVTQDKPINVYHFLADLYYRYDDSLVYPELWQTAFNNGYSLGPRPDIPYSFNLHVDLGDTQVNGMPASYEYLLGFQRGATLNLEVVTRNSGFETSAASETRVYLSRRSPESLRPSDSKGELLEAYAVPSLAPDQTHVRNLQVPLAADMAHGAWQLIFEADAQDANNEANEADNVVGARLAIRPNYFTLAPPHTEDFANPTLSDDWFVEEDGRVYLDSARAPFGAYQVIMDSRGHDVYYEQNGVGLMLNLESVDQPVLTFRWKHFSEETHSQDGVYVSMNGGASFQKVYSFEPGGKPSGTWMVETIDLAAAVAPLPLSHQTVILFRQYDNYQATTDGIAIGEVSVVDEGL